MTKFVVFCWSNSPFLEAVKQLFTGQENTITATLTLYTRVQHTTNMPKRKRDSKDTPQDGPGRILAAQRREVEDKLIHCKKLLNRALKTAKGFERQKLSRRVKTAQEKKDTEDLKRLEREIEALKVRPIL
jgi:hypothetical protein